MSLEPWQQALISCWATACWTDLAWSLRSRNVVKPEMVGGSIPERHRTVLEAEWNHGWEATKGRGILSGGQFPEEWGSKTRYQHPFKFEVPWRLVKAWLEHAWPHEARKRMRQLHDEFLALHAEREDEAYRPWHTSEERKERADRFAARMAAGDRDRLNAIRDEAKELIDAAIDAAAPALADEPLSLFEAVS